MNIADEEWNKNYSLQRKRSGFKSSADHFSKKESAERMLMKIMKNPSAHISEQLRSLNFPRGASVLDIGAGPGTLAVPLTKDGCKVTVVEPSDAMAGAMQKYKEFCGVGDEIPRIPKLWQDVDIDEVSGRYDYVISSFSLGVPNLLDALMKMNAAAKKQVHIFWFLNAPPWKVIKRDLWKKLRGEEYPDWFSYADVVWRALFLENIYANITVHNINDGSHYLSVKQAAASYSDILPEINDEQFKVIEDYLDDILIKESDNKYSIPGVGKFAHIWWDK
ncbi:MAG TPA: methyltransferase domain-containing protein [Methanocorpusculum sp.]|nr:methyltransferase domain-containing protein [Methanocorpusculum sp.]